MTPGLANIKLLDVKKLEWVDVTVLARVAKGIQENIAAE
jgi:hypothetical protein